MSGPGARAAGLPPTVRERSPCRRHDSDFKPHRRTDRLRLADAAVAPRAAKRPGVAGIGSAAGMSGEGLPVAASDHDRMETAS